MALTYVSNPASLANWGLQVAPLQVWRNPVWYRDDLSLGIILGPIGAPAAVMVLEEMRALGAEELWILGFAGSLTPKLPIGSVWAANQAWSDEGTSSHYEHDGMGRASSLLIARTFDIAPSLPVGALWTTDAIYRETASKIERFSGQGALGVDMETSALFHVGEHLDFPVGALMVMSDELFRPWRPGFQGPEVAKGVEEAQEILWQLMTHPSEMS